VKSVNCLILYPLYTDSVTDIFLMLSLEYNLSLRTNERMEELTAFKVCMYKTVTPLETAQENSKKEHSSEF